MVKKIEVMSEIEVTLRIIGGKCKPLILHILIEKGTKRYNELMKATTFISHKTLTNQLKELESDGLISRKSYNQIPPRVEYSITEKGKSLKQILDIMCHWGAVNCSDKFIITSPQCNNDDEC